MESKNLQATEEEKKDPYKLDNTDEQLETAKSIGKTALLQCLTTAAASWLIYQIGQTFNVLAGTVKKYKDQNKESE